MQSLHQGYRAASGFPVLIVRGMGHAMGQPRQSRTASEGLSISRYAAVVRGGRVCTSPTTTRSHPGTILSKPGVSHLRAAIALALRHNLVT